MSLKLAASPCDAHGGGETDMKQSETKFNDVGFDGLYLPKELNQRRYLLILLNIIVFGLTVAMLHLASGFVGGDEPHRFSKSLTTFVVIIIGVRLLYLIFYHYDPKGNLSEETTKDRKYMLIFSIIVLLGCVGIYFYNDFSITKTVMVVFVLLLDQCLHVCENKLYYKHLLRFYRGIEDKHGSTTP